MLLRVITSIKGSVNANPDIIHLTLYCIIRSNICIFLLHEFLRMTHEGSRDEEMFPLSHR